MMDLTPATRLAGCITLLALMAGCSKKEAPHAEPQPAPAPATVQMEKSADMAEPAAAAPLAPAPSPAAQGPRVQLRAGESSMERTRAEGKTAVPMAAPTAPLTTASAAQQMGGSAPAYNDGERKFVRSASASFRVKDVYVAALGIEDIVASHGGFVVRNDIGTSSTRTQRQATGDGKLIELNEYTVQGHLVVRVPSAKTQEFLRAIAGHVVFLDERKYAAHDAQFELLRAQLDAMRNQETQAELGEALSEGGKLMQKTDVIGMRSNARAARDAAVFAKKVFEDQVAFSTIELTLSQPSRVLQSELIDTDSLYRQLRPGFAERLREQLRDGWDSTLVLVLALAGLWPLWLLALLGGVPVWRAVRRNRKSGGRASAAD